LRRTTALISRGFFNLWVLSFAIVFGILYILFLWGIGRKLLRKIPFLEKRPSLAEAIPDYGCALLMGALLFYALPAIFLYPTEFALAGQSIFTTDFLFKLIGFAAGLLVVILTALALYKTGKGVSARFLKVLVTASLVVTMCSQLIVIIQFLLARRIIPMIRWIFRLIVVAVNNNIVFLYALMGMSFLLPLILFITGLKKQSPGKNPAEGRKIRAALRINRRWCAAVALGFVVAVTALTVIKAYTLRGVELSPAEPMTLAGEEILIPIPQVEDGHLHRFVYTASDGTEVRFIVIKKNAVAYGVGLDACDICGPTGYYERKNQVICRLCDVVMNISTIGFKGGCNPVPLAYALRSGSMVIETTRLENEKTRFK
ncbi:MAG: Fe-S-containing protein, partial [Treponema sp.]|nr:Fe-S-containing protein [Treponema sp.]